MAYDIDTGEPRWFGPEKVGGYSSPHLSMIDGVAQVLHVSGNGITSVQPGDGTVLWEHSWPGDPIVQPALTADGDVLISVSGSSGTLRLAVTHAADRWSVEERWT